MTFTMTFTKSALILHICPLVISHTRAYTFIAISDVFRLTQSQLHIYKVICKGNYSFLLVLMAANMLLHCE